MQLKQNVQIAWSSSTDKQSTLGILARSRSNEKSDTMKHEDVAVAMMYTPGDARRQRGREASRVRINGRFAHFGEPARGSLGTTTRRTVSLILQGRGITWSSP
jgi:hypothetical protein